MSTFAELFSDFQDLVKSYVEKLDITELSFMRMYTHGLQEFQKRTEYVEKFVEVNRLTPPNPPLFMVPNDLSRLVQVRGLGTGPCGPLNEIFLMQDYEQFSRNMDKWGYGQLETPTDYVMRMPHQRTIDNKVRMVSIWQREFQFYPDYSGDKILVWYIPDLHAISSVSPQWSAWFPYDTNFMGMFTTTSLNPSLAQFERVILDYALAMYIQSKGSANYKVYEQLFEKGVTKAIEIKPTIKKESVASYMFAPWA